MCPINYNEYDFDETPDYELATLIQEYNDIFNDAYPLKFVEGAWTLDKPVSLLEIRPDPPHDIVAEFLTAFSEYFYWEFDGYGLYFSRFPELASFAQQCETPARGILFGYDSRDVAQFSHDKGDGQFITESGDGTETLESDTIATKRDDVREYFSKRGLYEPAYTENYVAD